MAVDSDETLNTSDHVPVFAILNLEVVQKDVDANKKSNANQCVKNMTGRSMKIFHE